jgi:hypothetical protein
MIYSIEKNHSRLSGFSDYTNLAMRVNQLVSLARGGGDVGLLLMRVTMGVGGGGGAYRILELRANRASPSTERL